jgi:hypothetical protein
MSRFLLQANGVPLRGKGVKILILGDIGGEGLSRGAMRYKTARLQESEVVPDSDN